MAKEKASEGSKSEVIPGGVKASDLPPSVGGTKGTTPTPATANPGHAPVTTDAVASTPPVPAAPPVGDKVPPFNETAATVAPPGAGKLPSGFLDDDAPPAGRSNLLPNRPDRDRGREREIDLDEDAPPLPPMRSGPTVHDLIEGFDAFATATQNGNPQQMWRNGTDVMSAFGALMDHDDGPEVAFALAPPTRGVKSAMPVVGMAQPRSLDRVGLKLATARNQLSTAVASGRSVQFAGGEPHPESGSPVAMGSPRGAEATAIDPQSLLVLFELVMKVWEMFRRKSG